MELILWRHADAEDARGRPDTARALTARGRKQASRMAAWLRPRIDTSWRILVSPATRTLETVAALQLPFEEAPAVGLSATPQTVLNAVEWPGSQRNVLVVGHQPTLGEVATILLGGSDAGYAIEKGAAWWFEIDAEAGLPDAVLKSVMNPEQLGDDP
jgi:phosphohistidine phosphatase